MAKVPKKIRIFIITIVIISLSIFILPFFLLSIPSIQKNTISYIVEKLEDKTNTTVTIGGVNLYYYDFLKLYDVKITSKKGNTILNAERLEGSISLPFLLRKKINLNTIKVVNGTFYINKKDKNSDYNIKHIIDAFKSKKEKSILPWSLEFESIILYHCKIHYDIFSSPPKKDFDKDHLFFDNLSAKLSYFQSIRRKKIIHVEKFSAHEKNGLHIKDFHFNLTYEKGDILTNSIGLLVNNSSISINEFNINVLDTEHSIYGQSIIKSNIIPSDFLFINKNFKYFKQAVNFDIDLSGSLKSLNISNVSIKADSTTAAYGYFTVDNLVNKDKLYPQIEGEIQSLKVYKKGINIITKILNNNPKNKIKISEIDFINLNGKIKSNQKNLFFDYELNSNIGSIKDTSTIKFDKNGINNIETKIRTDSLCVNKIFKNSNLPSKVNLNLYLNSSISRDKKINGSVECKIDNFTFKNYTYKNGYIKGLFDNNSFDGSVIVKDKNLDLTYNGDIKFDKKDLDFDFILKINNANLQKLNLTKNKINNLKFDIISNIKGVYPEKINGDFLINKFSVVNENSPFSLSDAKIHIYNSEKEDSIKITSDIIEGNIIGNYNISTIYKELNNYILTFAPSLLSKKEISEKESSTLLNFALKIKPNYQFYNLLNTPYDITSDINIGGHFDKKDLTITILSNDLAKGKSRYRDLSFTAKNNNDKFIINSNVTSLSSKRKPKKLHASVITNNNNSKINLSIINEDKTIKNTLNFNSNIFYSKDLKDKTEFLIKINKSDLYLGDSLWTISPCDIFYNKTLLNIDNLNIFHKKQFINIDGKASKENSDTLKLNLNNFDVKYVMNLIPNFKLQFGGIVIGHIEAPHLFKDFTAFGSLSAQDFSINDVELGDLSLKTSWNNINSSININGDIIKKTNPIKLDSIAIVQGMYIPSKDSINLNVKAKEVDLSFLKCYLGNTLNNLKALGTGQVKVIGNTKRKTIGVYSDAYLQNASFDIAQLKSTYYFSDSIHLTPHEIRFDNITLKDKLGNKAIANGIIKHSYFKKMIFDIKIDAKNILALDIEKNSKDYYYGTAFGTGNIFIHGLQNDIIIDINAKTEKHTDMVFALNNIEDSNDYQFIKFINKKRNSTKRNRAHTGKDKSIVFNTNNFTLNLQIDVTSNAAITLITDPLTGDKITARGAGAIKLTYDNKNGMQLFGNYVVEKGSYYFVYENLLKRTFEIESGGRISFSGDPMNAKLDLRANYSVTADLNNLLSEDEITSLNISTSDILVNCVLSLTGNMNNLNIKLGLTFPSADAELKRKILNIINNDEILNQQIVFLLIFGNFSSINNSSSSSYSETTYVTNMVSSTVASTVASTFNSMLRNVFGYSNISLDLDYKASSNSDNIGESKEWTVGMSGNWLDDRLSIQGNLGQRENLTQSGATQFIGEFDLRLKVKNSDHWSWKVFNRANDNLYFKSALNTQGAGIVYNNYYRKSFFQKLKSFFQNIGKIFKRDKINKIAN